MILALLENEESLGEIVNHDIIDISEEEIIDFEDAYYAVNGIDLLDFVIDIIQSDIITQNVFSNPVNVKCVLLYEIYGRRYSLSKRFKLQKDSFEFYKKNCFDTYFKSSFMGVLCDRISQEIKLFNQDFLDGRYGTYTKDFDYPKMEVLA
jgi:hypothetical protein